MKALLSATSKRRDGCRFKAVILMTV